MSETVPMKLEITALYNAEVFDGDDLDPDNVARDEKVDLNLYVEELLSYLADVKDVSFTIKPIFTPENNA